MMKKISAVVLLLVMVLGMSGCATLFSGTKDKVYFTSNPEGARVYLDGIELCTTPCHAQIKRSMNNKSVEIKLDGYKTKVIEMSREFDVMTLLNLFNGWGFIVDAVTGAMFTYERKNFDITMERGRGSEFAVLYKDYETKSIEIDTVKREATIYVMKK